jgi:hypothetical protein
MNFNIDVDEKRRIVSVKIYGIWKKETAEDYHRQFSEAAKPLLKDKWAKLINLLNWKTSYPEMVAVIGEHIRWSHENNAVYSVYIVDNPVTRNQLRKMISHSGHEDSCLIFPTVAEGDNFLKENGF